MPTLFFMHSVCCTFRVFLTGLYVIILAFVYCKNFTIPLNVPSWILLSDIVQDFEFVRFPIFEWSIHKELFPMLKCSNSYFFKFLLNIYCSTQKLLDPMFTSRYYRYLTKVSAQTLHSAPCLKINVPQNMQSDTTLRAATHRNNRLTSGEVRSTWRRRETNCKESRHRESKFRRAFI